MFAPPRHRAAAAEPELERVRTPSWIPLHAWVVCTTATHGDRPRRHSGQRAFSMLPEARGIPTRRQLAPPLPNNSCREFTVT